MIAERDDGRRPGDVILDEVMRDVERKAAARAHLRPLPTPEPVVLARGEDGYDAHIRAGVYSVAYIGHQKISLFGRSVWVIRWRIIEGPAVGVELRMFMTAMQRDAKPSAGLAIVSAYGIATGLRPPRHLGQLTPADFLAGCTFEARVVDVRRDRHGVERPPGAIYSRVKALVARTAGTPQYLQRRGLT